MALYTVSTGTALNAQDINQISNLLTGHDPSTIVTVKNRISAYTPGAAYSAGYVGGTTSGAPTTGTFQTNDFVVDQSGFVWVCISGGSPGTWVRNSAADYGCVAVSTATQTLTVRSGQSGFDTVSLNGLQDPSADPHGMFSAAGHSITVPLAGYYLATGAVGTTLGTGNFSQAALLVKNGSAVSRGDEVRVVGTGGWGGNTTVSDVLHCAANDVITLGVYVEGACQIDTASGMNVLSVCLIT